MEKTGRHKPTNLLENPRWFQKTWWWDCKRRKMSWRNFNASLRSGELPREFTFRRFFEWPFFFVTVWWLVQKSQGQADVGWCWNLGEWWDKRINYQPQQVSLPGFLVSINSSVTFFIGGGSLLIRLMVVRTLDLTGDLGDWAGTKNTTWARVWGGKSTYFNKNPCWWNIWPDWGKHLLSHYFPKSFTEHSPWKVTFPIGK